MARRNFPYLPSQTIAVLFTVILFLSLVSGWALGEESNARIWIGADGQLLPFQSDEEILEFLRTAELVKWEDIPEGVTRPRKALLEKDGVQANAIFRDVEEFRRHFDDPGHGPRTNFRDSCLYECAAYELGRILGMDNIPPVVRRKLKGKQGTLQLWIEHSKTERDRARSKLRAPDMWRWGMQNRMAQLFDQLVFNDDRNPGNLLIDSDWKLWLIDHTRCFRTFTKLSAPEKIRYCERDFWENLKNLDEQEVKERLKDLLKSKEIKALLKRRDHLVQHLQDLIDENGEKAVLFQFKPAKG